MYWEFYSSSLKIRSNKTEDFLPSVFFHEDKEYNNPDKIGSIFNTFFTSLSSTYLTSDQYCDLYINRTFVRLKRENKIRWRVGPFKFIHTNENIVRRLINSLNQSSGAGPLGITSKVMFKHGKRLLLF